MSQGLRAKRADHGEPSRNEFEAQIKDDGGRASLAARENADHR